MATWGAAKFDEDLDHVLKNIACLPDSSAYRPTKLALMQAVVGELDGARARAPDAVAARIPSLKLLLEDPEYLKDRDDFSAWLHARLADDSTPIEIS
jgi:hypothetical protein